MNQRMFHTELLNTIIFHAGVKFFGNQNHTGYDTNVTPFYKGVLMKTKHSIFMLFNCLLKQSLYRF